MKRRLVEDLQTFSLPSLLRYEDRNSMAFSMESRLPFLDQELVDWVLRLPPSAIVHDGVEPGHPARRPAGRAHREGAHPAVEGRASPRPRPAGCGLAAPPSRASSAHRSSAPVRTGTPRRSPPRSSGSARARSSRRRSSGGRSTPRSGCACSSTTTARSRLGAAPDRALHARRRRVAGRTQRTRRGRARRSSRRTSNATCSPDRRSTVATTPARRSARACS